MTRAQVPSCLNRKSEWWLMREGKREKLFSYAIKFCWFSSGTFSLCSLGRPETFSVDQSAPNLIVIFISLLSAFYRFVPPSLVLAHIKVLRTVQFLPPTTANARLYHFCIIPCSPEQNGEPSEETR